MSEFVVSARKYRPSTFETVVGQEAITQTLKNAILTHHLVHAFLFCGSRGVGKTTTARILAKTINCSHCTDQLEPCDQCDSCLSFNSGNSMNIYELDAASNNSVDDIRSIIELIRIPPQIGKYRVFIIDEVHMLTSNAFNAFLKTLEEPPEHAIFILATTEKQKIIPTILSRCQIFDFNRIKVKDITHHLEQIAEKENVKFEKEALHLIATKSDGALRDALTIFDQMVTFSGGNITYQTVLSNLHLLDYDYYFKIVDYLKKEDIAGALLTFSDIIERGFDGNHFLLGLSEHFRNLLMTKDVRTLPLLDLTESVNERFIAQAKEWEKQPLVRALHTLSRADVEFKYSKNPRLLMEVTLMELGSLQQESEKKNP